MLSIALALLLLTASIKAASVTRSLASFTGELLDLQAPASAEELTDHSEVHRDKLHLRGVMPTQTLRRVPISGVVRQAPLVKHSQQERYACACSVLPSPEAVMRWR